MLDKAKLIYFMNMKNITSNDLADKLGINNATVYRKINGYSDFYRHEILKITEILSLSKEDVYEIFFDNKLV